MNELGINSWNALDWTVLVQGKPVLIAEGKPGETVEGWMFQQEQVEGGRYKYTLIAPKTAGGQYVVLVHENLGDPDCDAYIGYNLKIAGQPKHYSSFEFFWIGIVALAAVLRSILR